MIPFKSSTNSIFGISQPRDCSSASCIIFCKRSYLLVEKLLTTDLSAGRRMILWIQISVSFCTISSSLSCLFGRAMSIAAGEDRCGLDCSLRIFVLISLSVRFMSSTSRLLSPFCMQNRYPALALRTFLNWRMISEASLSLSCSQFVWIFS